MEQLASFMNLYGMKGQHTADRSMTRYKHDTAKMAENNDISTGPGRWALGVPNAYGNAAYVPNVTTINQKWGAAHDMSSTKTDVESDLRNLARPTVRTTCGQYQPGEKVRTLTAMPEVEIPQTSSHLVDPPCTLRGTGINRWAWLCENPQENVMVPFEHLVDSRHSSKDAIYDQLVGPMDRSPLALDRRFLCKELLVAPAGPVPSLMKKGDTPNFHDTIPGYSQRTGQTPVAKEPTRVGPPPVTGKDNPLAPPRGPPTVGERERVSSGVLAPPPPFANFIAPH